ncbi:tetratricopeptide repeat protein [Psychrobacter phenylpyruvicus]|uniref:Predicted O-linked N-acetylglucosamine transferase, SPINDLY family n=2 Tax=Psychrobacter phenylpyruvicus TaxID=29432 RepID=A0A379LJ92_9GAMM|nr:tetratricopeptide repeat protein [Psychrobacter phenylpyruvicus]SUD89967.1 Predicted O-linked N-acetylglucosamine transferase, SPINDLY family [Psychrobacter phenylpyruvicus]
MSDDMFEGLDDETIAKIKKLQDITRETDGNEAFANAQFTIALLFMYKGALLQAISTWEKIKKSDSLELFARAQFDIGCCYEELGSKNEAIRAWENVDRENDANSYARAQLNLGVIYAKDKKLEKALSHWRKIRRSDSLEGYANANLNIGWALELLGQHDEAIKTWYKILREDSLTSYAEAQLNIGLNLIRRNQPEEAIAIWKNIGRDDSKSIYARAKYYIGHALNDVSESIKEWEKVTREDDPAEYSKIQFSIGNLLINQDNKLRVENNKSILRKAKKSYLEAKQLFPYEAYCCVEICELLLKDKTHDFGRVLESFFDKITFILHKLTINFDNTFERKLAHYTSIDVANILLSVDNQERPSSFRLNTINNVNDPSEGQMLDSFLDINSNKVVYNPEFDERFQAFVGCFTFNHNSLNQFRLYGKKNNLEASGVSLVFQSTFFKPKSLNEGLSFLSSFAQISKSEERIFEHMDIENINSSKKIIDKGVLNQNVMRCIYIEPESRYVQLAQRNKETFYREFGKETIAEKNWEEYHKEPIPKSV